MKNNELKVNIAGILQGKRQESWKPPSLMSLLGHCGVWWPDYGQHKFLSLKCRAAQTLTCAVKPSQSAARPDHPATSRAPCELPVQDKQSELGPSATLRLLTSASVKQSEATLAPDKFYEASAPTPGLKQAHLLFPLGLFSWPRPLSQALLAVSLGWDFYFKEEFCWYQLLQRQMSI